MVIRKEFFKFWEIFYIKNMEVGLKLKFFRLMIIEYYRLLIVIMKKRKLIGCRRERVFNDVILLYYIIFKEMFNLKF